MLAGRPIRSSWCRRRRAGFIHRPADWRHHGQDICLRRRRRSDRRQHARSARRIRRRRPARRCGRSSMPSGRNCSRPSFDSTADGELTIDRETSILSARRLARRVATRRPRDRARSCARPRSRLPAGVIVVPERLLATDGGSRRPRRLASTTAPASATTSGNSCPTTTAQAPPKRKRKQHSQAILAGSMEFATQ